MKKHVKHLVKLTHAAAIIIIAATIATGTPAPADNWTLIDFDTGANWTAGSGVITSYQTDHRYTESGWVFTGGPAVRQTTTETNGVVGAFGSHGWRLRDAPDTVWTGTLQNGAVGRIRFDIRAWNETADIDWIVRSSSNGGSTFTDALTINRSLLSGAEWSTLEVDVFATAWNDIPESWILFEVARISGERVMIDNFAFTPIPEPHSTAFVLGCVVVAVAVWRRRAAFHKNTIPVDLLAQSVTLGNHENSGK